jgi:hypothetical protein
MNMRRTAFIILLVMGFTITKAQANDSLVAGTVHIVMKDSRIDILGKKMAEYNEGLASRPGGIKMGRGYRLMVLSTTDRNQAMAVRSRLLQLFQDQKVYMTFQSPYIKVKFGNFADKEEAERYRKQIAATGVVSNNIYLVPETVEIKIDKNAPAED